jgi:hypothetical protein
MLLLQRIIKYDLQEQARRNWFPGAITGYRMADHKRNERIKEVRKNGYG